jgi:Xaa-Pro dipeptidase
MKSLKKNSIYEKAELTGLNPSFFLKNRKKYISKLKQYVSDLQQDGIIFLKGGEELFKYDNDDDYHYFIQESNFYYLTGVREPGYYAAIIIDEDDPKLSLFVPTPDERTKIFLHVETLEDIEKKYNCSAYELVKMQDEINKLNPSKIYVLNGVNSDSDKKVLSAADFLFTPPYSSLNERIDNNILIYECLADSRVCKSEEEIELLKYINEKTVEAHKKTMKNIKNCKIERDVENTFFRSIRFSLYSRNHPYEHICGCGPNASTLHYLDNDCELEQGKLILMDMGGKCAGYVSDVTSTVPINGKFSEKQKDIYNIVLDANLAVRNNAKIGVSWLELHKLAERKILEGLKNLGMLKGDVDDMLNKRVCYYFMPHGLGHLMGIDVHDAGGYLSFTPERSKEKGLNCLRTARILEKNMVLSDEPGIYFIRFLLEQGYNDETVKDFFDKDKIENYIDEVGGVRIEDDILINEDGCELLTVGLPRTVEEIEEWMKDEKK